MVELLKSELKNSQRNKYKIRYNKENKVKYMNDVNV